MSTIENSSSYANSKSKLIESNNGSSSHLKKERTESIKQNNLNSNTSLAVTPMTCNIIAGSGCSTATTSRRTSLANGTSGRRRASMFDPIDPTEIQKTLYQNLNKTNQSTDQSNEQLNENAIGKIEFGIQYLNDSHMLVLDILRLFNVNKNRANELSLAQLNIPSNSDFYCKCTLFPDRQTFQTTIAKRALDPTFDEQFEFEKVDLSSLDYRSLELTVYECQRGNLNAGSQDECIGVAHFYFNNQNFDTKKIFLRDLKPYTKTNEENDLGELMFSLAYLPAAERLTIVVMKARNLKSLGVDKKNLPDPYVKVNILTKENGKRLKKKKTSTQKSTLNPVYNEEIVFNLKKDLLDDIVISLTVYHDTLTSREPLGSIAMSSSSRGNEYIQWKEMIDGKKAIGWWHQLCPTSSGSESDGGGGGAPGSCSAGGGGSSSNTNCHAQTANDRQMANTNANKNKQTNNKSVKTSSGGGISFTNLKMKSLSLLSNSPLS